MCFLYNKISSRPTSCVFFYRNNVQRKWFLRGKIWPPMLFANKMYIFHILCQYCHAISTNWIDIHTPIIKIYIYLHLNSLYSAERLLLRFSKPNFTFTDRCRFPALSNGLLFCANSYAQTQSYNVNFWGALFGVMKYSCSSQLWERLVKLTKIILCRN